MTAPATVAAPETAVLRLRPERTARLEALLIAAGPHLEPVVDIGTAQNGDLLVVVPTPAARLPELLDAPSSLTAGEAVTVLVPLAQALVRMHATGVAHGRIRPAAVVLDRDGSPAWTAPLAPTLRRSAGAARFAERAAEDLAAFRELGRALLGPALPEGDAETLATALFRVAAPEPVRLTRPSTPAPTGPPARLLPAAAIPVPDAPARRWALPARLRTVRPRVWAAAGAAAALLIGALVLLPSGDGAPAATPGTRPPRAARSATPSPPPTVAATTGAADAVRALLAARDQCLDRGSEPCLRRIDAVDSPVLAADLRLVRSGAEVAAIDPAGLAVAESGGTALATGPSTTVLAIRTRDGWRLRDVVAEPPGKG